MSTTPATADRQDVGPYFRTEYLRIMLRSVIASSVVLLGLYCLAVARYGSVNATVATIRGVPLIVESNPASFGVADPDQIMQATFKLTNISVKPVRLLGSQSNCTCVNTDDLPMEIGAGESVVVRYSVRAKGGPRFSAKAALLTNSPSQTRVELGITGRVRVVTGDRAPHLSATR